MEIKQEEINRIRVIKLLGAINFLNIIILYMLFKNISNFSNIHDYLPILNGCITSDLIILFLVFHGAFKSFYLHLLTFQTPNIS